MTRQEIFDLVAKALIVQGAASVTEAGGCAYRGKNGCKCAIGHLMSDDIYDERFGTLSVYVLYDAVFSPNRRRGRPAEFDDYMVEKCYKLFNQFDPDVSCGFLADLQRSHDNCRDEIKFVDKLVANLREMAKKYDLDDSVLDDQLKG